MAAAGYGDELSHLDPVDDAPGGLQGIAAELAGERAIAAFVSRWATPPRSGVASLVRGEGCAFFCDDRGGLHEWSVTASG